jgi:hypothetical protein
MLMKFGTQTKKNMLSSKNAKPEVCRHDQYPFLGAWPPKNLNFWGVNREIPAKMTKSIF